MKTTQEIIRKMRFNALHGMATHIGIITERKYNEIEKAVKDFKRDAEIDKKLGVINEEQYNADIEIYNLYKKSLNTASVI